MKSPVDEVYVQSNILNLNNWIDVNRIKIFGRYDIGTFKHILWLIAITTLVLELILFIGLFSNWLPTKDGIAIMISFAAAAFSGMAFTAQLLEKLIVDARYKKTIHLLEKQIKDGLGKENNLQNNALSYNVPEDTPENRILLKGLIRLSCRNEDLSLTELYNIDHSKFTVSAILAVLNEKY
ncbi:MAG: hypothetical protein LBQ98_08115 [Nitrososphaerota archaeon]|nr:hypothetical protein [Nitrososphaerota archaeon]